MQAKLATLLALCLSTPAYAGQPGEYSPATKQRIQEALARPPAPTKPVEPPTPAEQQRAAERYKRQLVLGSIVSIGGAAMMIAGVAAHREVDLRDPQFADARTSFAVMLGAGGALAVTGIVVALAAKKPKPLTTALLQGRVRF